jgi:hypothetical protein
MSFHPVREKSFSNPGPPHERRAANRSKNYTLSVTPELARRQDMVRIIALDNGTNKICDDAIRCKRTQSRWLRF